MCGLEGRSDDRICISTDWTASVLAGVLFSDCLDFDVGSRNDCGTVSTW